ncbi:hypothetical protein H9Y04_36455 [Streptomyces sp. TRM66268-LWL]|uniref:Uncharacterized protein n=1 Tax=Streptomyces polyasparticus TaxID=2767826 RepID=A0ABR7SRA3_9ACTN|nr:hypothetical protein [Streptomyces polyasparticus]MBC9718040.1 hypothetical protein [Streptomyces polyasparticus]
MRRNLTSTSTSYNSRARSSASPFDSVDVSLLNLTRGSSPLTLPAVLLSEQEGSVAWPVDLVRARMAHPSTPQEARARVWAEIVRRRAAYGEPWGTVAVAMVVPALRRALARMRRPAELDQCELEQAVLVAVAEQLAALEPDGEAAEFGLRLVRAGDRAAHRLAYGVLCERRNPTEPLDEGAVPTGLPGTSMAQVYAVLECAEAAGVITGRELELIGGTRLDRLSAAECARRAGISVRAMFRSRAEAEERLVKALLAGELTVRAD